MILYGASGHAKVVIDICIRNGEKISGIIDDNKAIVSLLKHQVTQIENLNAIKDVMIITIGNNSTRKKIATKIKSEFGLAIHPNAVIADTVKIEKGSVVMAGSVVNSSTKIGKHCIINTSATIDHDCLIEDFVHISPNATLCGGIKIGEGSHIGAGAIIIPNIKIGKWCTIGAGSVIINEVADGETVVGNPSRVINRKI